MLSGQRFLIPLVAGVAFALTGCAGGPPEPDTQFTQIVASPINNGNPDPARVNVQWIDLNKNDVELLINGYPSVMRDGHRYLIKGTKQINYQYEDRGHHAHHGHYHHDAQGGYETVTLNADTLFHFDESGMTDMLPEGRAQLDDLVKELDTGYTRVAHILITGYTDRLGTSSYNQNLSQARADTVRDYLHMQGVDASMDVIVMGERDPVVTDCHGQVSTSALIACLQPNRRVEVQIAGVAKQ